MKSIKPETVKGCLGCFSIIYLENHTIVRLRNLNKTKHRSKKNDLLYLFYCW